MSIPISGRGWALKGLTRNQKFLVQALGWFADFRGCDIFPANETLGDMIECDERTVRRLLSQLQQTFWFTAPDDDVAADVASFLQANLPPTWSWMRADHLTFMVKARSKRVDPLLPEADWLPILRKLRSGGGRRADGVGRTNSWQLNLPEPQEPRQRNLFHREVRTFKNPDTSDRYPDTSDRSTRTPVTGDLSLKSQKEQGGVFNNPDTSDRVAQAEAPEEEPDRSKWPAYLREGEARVRVLLEERQQRLEGTA